MGGEASDLAAGCLGRGEGCAAHRRHIDAQEGDVAQSPVHRGTERAAERRSAARMRDDGAGLSEEGVDALLSATVDGGEYLPHERREGGGLLAVEGSAAARRAESGVRAKVERREIGSTMDTGTVHAAHLLRGRGGRREAAEDGGAGQGRRRARSGADGGDSPKQETRLAQAAGRARLEALADVSSLCRCPREAGLLTRSHHARRHFGRPALPFSHEGTSVRRRSATRGRGEGHEGRERAAAAPEAVGAPRAAGDSERPAAGRLRAFASDGVARSGRVRVAARLLGPARLLDAGQNRRSARLRDARVRTARGEVGEDVVEGLFAGDYLGDQEARVESAFVDFVVVYCLGPVVG